MTVSLRAATTADEDVTSIIRIIGVASPEAATSAEELAWQDRTYPGGSRFIASLDGRPAGVGTVGRIFVYPVEFEAFWATVDVLPEERRRGVGSAILARLGHVAAAAGKTHLHIPTMADRPEAVAFLVNRGFVEHDRMRAVQLGLKGLRRPAVEPPSGIILTDLAARPELVAGVHAVAREAFPDIPGGDEPMATGDLAEFRARDVDRPGIPADGFMVAIDEATGRVAGYAALLIKAGDPTIALHDMTAVARDWRGRGLATTLKLRTIGWAIDHGLTALETGNDESNLAMRAVNRRLGYRPLPDALTMAGRLDQAS